MQRRTFDSVGFRRAATLTLVCIAAGDDEKRELRAKPESGDPEVTVSMARTDGRSTDVEVTARTGPVTWDKAYARRVLDRIIEHAGQ